MRAALAADLAAIANVRLRHFHDARLAGDDACDRKIHSVGEHDDAFAELAAQADWTVIIAPEVDGILERLARRVVHVGGKLMGPPPDVIALAADKHLLATRLASHGVRVPRGVLLRPDEPLPCDMTYPAVLKPVDGAGSLGVQYIASKNALVDFASAARWRLEEFIPGTPASVAFVCGPGTAMALPPCEQELSGDGCFRYLGGSTPARCCLSAAVRERVQNLARRAVQALGDVVIGYVGVDIVIGEDEADDAVIEINPRLTTSYVGLRALAETNLAQAMLDLAGGCAPALSFRRGAVRFTAHGETFFDEPSS